jgi:hypothetical protein
MTLEYILNNIPQKQPYVIRTAKNEKLENANTVFEGLKKTANSYYILNELSNQSVLTIGAVQNSIWIYIKENSGE